MVNAIAKGSRTEKEVMDWFRKKGYALTWKTIRTKYQNLDLFGLFDLVARNQDEIIYIQVKTNYSGSINKLCSEKGNQGISIYEFVCNYRQENEKVIVWVKDEKKKKHKIYLIQPLVGAELIKEIDYTKSE